MRRLVVATTMLVAGIVVAPGAAQAAPAPTPGYWLLGDDGGVFAFGGATFGGAADFRPDEARGIANDLGPVTGGDDGYLVVNRDGSVFDCKSTCNPSPFKVTSSGGYFVTGIASEASGYLLAEEEGSVDPAGDARSYGDASELHLDGPIVGITTDDLGGNTGYWLVGADGGVFSYGSARFYGSTGGLHLAAPIVGIAPTIDGRGYWLVGADGGVFAYGDAGFHGSLGGVPLDGAIEGITPSPDGRGYYLVGADGGVFAFGDATYEGSEGGHQLRAPVIGIAPSCTSASAVGCY